MHARNTRKHAAIPNPITKDSRTLKQRIYHIEYGFFISIIYLAKLLHSNNAEEIKQVIPTTKNRCMHESQVD